MRRLCAIFLVLSWFGTLAGAAAAPIHTSCQTEERDTGEKIICHVRTYSGKALSDIEVELSDGERLDFAEESYAWTTHKSAFYFLVQSSALEREQLKRIGEFLDRAAYPAGKQTIGVALAGKTLVEEAPLGSSRIKLSNIASSLGFSTPPKDNTILMSSLKKAVEKASQSSSDRKAVIVLSDAKPKPARVDEQAVIDAAKDNDVAVYFVSFGKKGQAPTKAFSTIGSKTHGGTYDLSELSQSDTMEFASRLFSLLENGFILTIDAEGLPKTSEFTVSAVMEGQGAVSSDPITISRLTEDPWHVDAGNFVSDNLILILAIVGLAAGAILIASSQAFSLGDAAANLQGRLQGRTAEYDPVEPTQAGDAETRILTPNWSEDEQPSQSGWLELLNSNSPPVALRPGNMRVGRGSDNDIRLTNRSVHRRHALLQISEDGTLSIHDLGTKNGVFVNGDRCSQRDLADGDIIELGEVKLRFVAQQA